MAASKRHILIGCTNKSSVVNDTDFENWIKAQQKQLDYDFAPEWDTHAELLSSKHEAIPSSAWTFELRDESDQPGAAGYHDENGNPLALAFAKTDIDHGLSWTVTASHEILETLADPDINRVVLVQSGPHSMRLVAYENCDPVEADSLGKAFTINNKRVLLSDFVTRAWFEPGAQGPMDAYGHITQPFELAQGGYISVLDLDMPHQGWTQVTAALINPKSSRHPEYSRRRALRKARNNITMEIY